MASNGPWTQNELQTVMSHPIRELDGRILGVVGWGELGRGTARAAEAFGMRVVIANRRGDSPRAGGRRSRVV
jgi:glycerate dehydrogenase